MSIVYDYDYNLSLLRVIIEIGRQPTWINVRFYQLCHLVGRVLLAWIAISTSKLLVRFCAEIEVAK